MTLDYKNNLQHAMENGVAVNGKALVPSKPNENSGNSLFGGIFGQMPIKSACGRETVTFSIPLVCKDTTFKNFPNLRVEQEITFVNCIFENCSQVAFEGCCLQNCTFKNVNCIEGHTTDFDGCTFTGCCSQGPLLTIDTKGKISHCNFDSITALGGDGYVIDAVYKTKEDVQSIEHCTFFDCQVESEDGTLCSCSYFKPFSSVRTVSINNLDLQTCKIREVES